MAERVLEYMRLADLRLNPRNPKGHALAELDGSFSRFGYLDPVIVDERTGLLVAGHGRAEGLAERQRRGDPAPEGVQIAEDGAWLIPVVRGWASKDDAEASAALLASNQLVVAGGWQPEGLAGMLSDLAAGPGLDGIGFAQTDLDGLLADLARTAGTRRRSRYC